MLQQLCQTEKAKASGRQRQDGGGGKIPPWPITTNLLETGHQPALSHCPGTELRVAPSPSNVLRENDQRRRHSPRLAVAHSLLLLWTSRFSGASTIS